MKRIARLQRLNGCYRFRAGVPIDLRAHPPALYDETWLRLGKCAIPEFSEPGRFTLKPSGGASFDFGWGANGRGCSG